MLWQKYVEGNGVTTIFEHVLVRLGKVPQQAVSRCCLSACCSGLGFLESYRAWQFVDTW